MPDDRDAASSALPPAESSAIRTFHLGSTGLRRILGSLEAELMEVVWRLTSGAEEIAEGWTTIGSVCQSLGPPYNYKTVQTVMNRLVEKGLLARREQRRAHEYRARLTRDELVAQVTRSVLDGLVRDFGAVAIAELVQTLHTVSPEQLKLLEELAADSTHVATPAPDVPPASQPHASQPSSPPRSSKRPPQHEVSYADDES